MLVFFLKKNNDMYSTTSNFPYTANAKSYLFEI